GVPVPGRRSRGRQVTGAAGAAASVAVAGGMLFAVNITPLPGAPSHVAVQPAGPAANSGPATNSGTSADHRADSRRGGGGGGGSGSAGGTLTGSGTPAGGAPL